MSGAEETASIPLVLQLGLWSWKDLIAGQGTIIFVTGPVASCCATLILGVVQGRVDFLFMINSGHLWVHSDFLGFPKGFARCESVRPHPLIYILLWVVLCMQSRHKARIEAGVQSASHQSINLDIVAFRCKVSCIGCAHHLLVFGGVSTLWHLIRNALLNGIF